MPYLLGTDEAGYGPNLGPLVVSASLWRVPKGTEQADLYQILSRAVSHDAVGRRKGLLPLADSKQLYKPGGGLADLELGVLAALAILSRPATTWREAWRSLDADATADLAAQPWHDGYDHALPLNCETAELATLAASFSSELVNSGSELLNLRSTVVFPARFNRLVAEHGNKASALSAVTLTLVAALIEQLPDEPIIIVCDKHGGRNSYGALLQRQFPEYLVEVVREGRAESVYRFGPVCRRVGISFVAKGESFLPSALASMTCKYLRELAMRPFNEFWARHVPNLKPTAGYPEDAVRFKREIAAAQERLGIEDDLLWRCK